MHIRKIKKRKAPYHKRLETILRNPANWPRYQGTSPNGSSLSIYVFGGSQAWPAGKEAADSRLLFLVANPDQDPSLYDWSILAGHEPIPVIPKGHLPKYMAEAIAAALIEDGVEGVLIPNGDGRGQRYIRQEVAA